MTTERYLDAFCQQFNDMIEDLIRIFPEETDFKVFLNGYRLVRGATPQIIIEQFIGNVYPFKEKIMNKDESFFLEDRGKDIEKKLESAGSNLVEKALNLKHLWKDRLNNDNKEIIWKYLQVMILLSEKWYSAFSAVN